MIFLSPFYLSFLVLVSVPIILHLFYKRKYQKVHFSSLKFLEMTTTKKRYFSKLKNFLLLTLRCLLIILLSLLLSRPMLKSKVSGFKHKVAETSYVIVFDNSRSMNYREKNTSRKYLAEKQLSNLINSFDSTSRGAVIFAPEYKIIDAKNYSPANIISPSFDMEVALLTAVDYLKKTHLPTRDLYIFTDAQKDGFKKIREKIIPEEINVYFFDFGKKSDENIFISEVKTDETLTRGEPFKIKVEISNYNLKEKNNIFVDLYIERKQIETKMITITPHQKSEIYFDYKFDEVGHYGGHITLSPDALEEDNKYFINFKVKDARHVLCVGEKRDDTFYLKYALSPFYPQRIGHISPTVILPSDVGKTALSLFDVLILSNVKELATSSAFLIRNYVREGKGVIIFAGEELNDSFYNEKMLAEMRIGTLEDKNISPSFLTSLDLKNEFLGKFRNPQDTDFSSIRFSKYYNLFCKSNCNILAKFDYLKPAILEVKVGAGKILFFNTSASPSFSNLCLSSMFVPLLHSAVHYLSGKSSLFYRYNPGDKISLLKDQIIKKEGDKVSYGGIYTFSSAGNYQIIKKEILEEIVSLNYPREESNLSRIDKKELVSILGKNLKYFPALSVNLDKMERVGKRDVGELLIYIVFAIILFEMLVLLI